MPTYNHHCFSCNHEWEDFRPAEKASEKQVCPSCGSHKTGRKFNPVAVIYKGEGFYNTDNKGEK